MTMYRHCEQNERRRILRGNLWDSAPQEGVFNLPSIPSLRADFVKSAWQSTITNSQIMLFFAIF
ncbi:hypothetical protein [Helicobacter sp. T3_23-1056]